jgi:septum formation protein
MSAPLLVLASASSARRALLLGAGLRFSVKASTVDEEALKVQLRAGDATPMVIAAELARAKAVQISLTEPGLVIGADQTLDLGGALFSKPATVQDLRAQLCQLRGQRHSLHSALALASHGQIVWQTGVSAHLTMRQFSDAFLETYLCEHGDRVLGCVGGYQLESAGVQLFDQIEGDYFTILGLPLTGLLAALRQFGVVMT